MNNLIKYIKSIGFIENKIDCYDLNEKYEYIGKAKELLFRVIIGEKFVSISLRDIGYYEHIAKEEFLGKEFEDVEKIKCVIDDMLSVYKKIEELQIEFELKKEYYFSSLEIK